MKLKYKPRQHSPLLKVFSPYRLMFKAKASLPTIKFCRPQTLYRFFTLLLSKSIINKNDYQDINNETKPFDLLVNE